MNLSEKPMAPAEQAPPSPLPEPVQGYVLDAFGDGDEALGRDLLLSIARRVAYAREVHPRFGGMASVCDEFDELKRAFCDFGASGDPRRMCEEAIDVMATCIRLVNFEGPEEDGDDEDEDEEEKPYVSGAVAGVVPG